MTKATLLTGMFYVTAAVGVSACGPIVPVSPTWKDDVRPLVVARCMRCHDEPRHIDPKIDPTIGTMPVTSFNYPPDVVLTPSPPGGLGLLHLYGPNYARGDGAGMITITRRMPPPPAEALEDWQIEMLDAWHAVPAR